MIRPSGVSATSCADHESPEAVLCRSRWRRLAKGGVIPISDLDVPIGASDLPLPRWGVLSGKSLHGPPLAAVLSAAPSS